MPGANYWIDRLNLEPHPEGGFYRQTYRAPLLIEQSALPKAFNGPRNAATATRECPSLFHVLKWATVWAFAVAYSSGQSVPGTGAVSGRVIDDVTGNGIPGIMLIVSCTSSADKSARCDQHQTKTQSQGLFKIEDLPAGTYLMIPNDSSKKFLFRGGVLTAVVEAGQERISDDIVLQPQAVIRGRVLDSAGKPIVGAPVEVLSKLWDHGYRLQKEGAALTDRVGKYTVEGLWAGSYYVSALESKMALRFLFPGVLATAEAQKIQTRPGREYPDIDIRLPTLPLHRVTGKIIQDVPAPEQSVRVALLSANGTGSVGELRESNIAGEKFEFANVPSGDYVLVVRRMTTLPEGHALMAHVLAKQEVTVGTTDVTNLALLVLSPVRISGQVLLDQPQGNELIGTHITLFPSEPFAFSDYKESPAGIDGSFTFQDCEPARYNLHVDPPTGTFVSSVEYNRQPLTKQILDFSSGVHAELSVRLRRRAALAHGTLADDVKNAYVILIPSDWTPGDLHGWVRKTVENGSFVFPNVAPGSYILAATQWSNRRGSELEDPDVRKELMQEGQTIELRSADEESFQVHVLPDESTARIAARLGL